MSLVDQAARDAIATDLEHTLVVEASAGTGKTTALVARIVALLRSGTTELSRVAAVTFTEKASGEMTLRLRAAIEAERHSVPDRERRRLEHALRQLEEASIGTIHGFCANLLRERPVQSGLDPLFTVVDEEASARLFSQAFDAWWTDALGEMPEAVRRFLRRAAVRSVSARGELSRAAWSQAAWRDHRAPLQRPSIDREALVGEAMTALKPFVAFAGQRIRKVDRAITHLFRVRDWYEAASAQQSQTPDTDALEAQLVELARWWSWRDKGFQHDQGGFTLPELMRARDDAHTTLTRVVTALDADLAAALHQALWPVVDAYESLLRTEGAVDYFDLLAHTARVLREQPDVRRDLQQRFTHLLVDEFQDTDPLQADILLLLASDAPAQDDPDAVHVVPGKLFVVGDPKQSIYRFRRADVALYLRIRDRLVSQGAHLLHLSTSFRSDPRIQDAVNHAFSAVMTGGTQANYVPQQPARSADPTRPAVIALSLPEPYTPYGRVSQAAIGATEPPAVARFVEWLVRDSGWQVIDPTTRQPADIAPEHICLLFRRLHSYRGSVAAPFADALQAVGLPTVLVGGGGVFEREELQVLRNALNAIDRPNDALSVYATLRGPLFAVGDDALLLWRDQVGAIHPFTSYDGDDALLTEVSDALAVLARLHRGRNHRPIAQTLRDLLDRTRAHAGLALWSGGAQVLANVLALVERARRYESDGAPTFRGFVHHLDDLAQRRAAGEAAIVEEDSDSIRLMSVHKAKGLEFPVVILCDSAYPGIPSRPGRYVDSATGLCAQRLAMLDPIELTQHREALVQAETEEADRLLYVAATRARDVLVVPTMGDQPLDGWTRTLTHSLVPPAEAWRDGAPAPGCPDFHTDATVVRPHRAPPPDSGVRPGHYAHDGVHRTFWDGHLLGPPPTAEAGFRKVDAELLAPDADLNHARIRAAHEAWAVRREERVQRGCAVATRIVRPSHSEGVSPTFTDVAWADTGVLRSGPRGRDFGSLVHDVLERVPLDATPEAITALVQRRARAHPVATEDVPHAIASVRAALVHPLFDRARRATRVERELVISHRRPDGLLIDGTADLVFWEDGAVVVVDYKTDHDASDRAASYARQLGLYADALAAATGLPAEAVALSV